MTSTQLLLLGLVVAAAVVAGYFLGRWASAREQGERAARPSPLPELPDHIPGGTSFDDTPASAPARDGLPEPRRRGAPPPVSAGGDRGGDDIPAPRQRRAPPPASTADDGGSSAGDAQPRVRRGPPPPAAAGVMGTGGGKNRET
jgi:hypothetical protein